MGQKQHVAQEAMKQGAIGRDRAQIDENLVNKFLLNRALIVDVAHSYGLSGLPLPPDRPSWILLEDMAAMSQWQLFPPEGDFDLAWPLWGLSKVTDQ